MRSAIWCRSGWAVMLLVMRSGTSAAAASPVPERLQGVHFDPSSPSPPGTGHWIADYHLIRDRVRGELAELVETTGVNFLDVMVLIPITMREKAAAPSDQARDVTEWANMRTLNNLVAFLDDCHGLGVSVEIDLACNLWIPMSVDTPNHIGQSEWWPKPDDTPWTEAAVWYEQIIRYVEGAVAYTERFVKEVWPRFRKAGRRPVGSPIMLPILADTPYWNVKSPEARLSSIRNLHKWLVDDLALPPDYWVMSTYPCCDPATDGFQYLREIVRILGPENAGRVISTDFKGAGHDLAGCIVDKRKLTGAEVLRWHFDKVTEYGFGGWWIWSYRDTDAEPTGLRDVQGKWKPDLVGAVRERTQGRAAGQ